MLFSLLFWMMEEKYTSKKIFSMRFCFIPRYATCCFAKLWIAHYFTLQTVESEQLLTLITSPSQIPGDSLQFFATLYVSGSFRLVLYRWFPFWPFLFIFDNAKFSAMTALANYCFLLNDSLCSWYLREIYEQYLARGFKTHDSQPCSFCYWIA